MNAFRKSGEKRGVLDGCNGAAARLGLPWTTRLDRMRKLGIPRDASLMVQRRLVGAWSAPRTGFATDPENLRFPREQLRRAGAVGFPAAPSFFP